MNINPEIAQVGGAQQRRQVDAQRGQHRPGPVKTSSSDQRVPGQAQDVERYVEILKTMDPADIHRIEDLRGRIQAGTYSSTPEELVDPLLEALEGDEHP